MKKKQIKKTTKSKAPVAKQKINNPGKRDRSKPLTHRSAPPISMPMFKSLAKDQRKALRKHLDERLHSLHDRAMLLEQELAELDDHRFFRVCIFGSARIKTDTKIYNDVFNLARYLSWESIDVLTGGGPGLMEAGNKGASYGQEERKTKSISLGLTIELPFEPLPNLHLDVKRHHYKFSSRLDDFMRLSHAVVCTPGGIGTLLELYFSWQLIQVGHITQRPIVLMDKAFWTPLIDWMKDMPLTRGLVSAKDFNFLHIVDTPEEAAELLYEAHREFRKKHQMEETILNPKNPPDMSVKQRKTVGRKEGN